MSGSEIFLRVHTAVRHGVGREVLSLPDMNGQGPGVEFEPAAIHVKIRNEAKTPHKKCRSCETTQHSSSRTSCGSGTAAARRAGRRITSMCLCSCAAFASMSFHANFLC